MGLVVFGDDLPREALRSGLARELGRPVALMDAASRGSAPVVTVTWHKDRAELAVTYDEPGRGTLSRVVRARPAASQNVEDAILLASSLVRNEADELLGKPAEPPPAELAAPAAPSPPPGPPKRDFVPAYASLVHPLASNIEHPYATTRFGLNLIYGRAGELENGVQIGMLNVVAGKEGVASGNMSGLQLAPFFGANYVTGHASGLQIGYFANIAAAGIAGAQVGFGANVAGGDLEGLQLAAVNVARDVRGAQIGVVNVAQKLEGVTLGLVNVADDIDGVPIGLVSVTRTGGVHPLAWASSATYANVGLKFATKHTYTMISGRYTSLGSADYLTDGGRPLHLDAHEAVGGGFHVGGHVPIESTFVDFDLGFSAMAAPARSIQTFSDGHTRAYHEVVLDPEVRVLGGYSFASHASLFFGGGLVVRVRLIDQGEDAVARVLPEMIGGIQF